MSSLPGFRPEERAIFAGSPYSPSHTGARRLAYLAFALFLGTTSTFCNALTTVNTAAVAGPLGLYAAQAAALPAIYVAMNASANLTLVRARAQFGTVIRAPESGTVGEVGIRVGAYVTNGTQLLAIVPAERWIIVNLKEAQTGKIRAGQAVRITVDALGGLAIKGRVERLAPAAGSEFAVLKQDNATGNFVKIPQRIGVRIALDPSQSNAARLRPGMSVEIAIDTRQAS